MIVNQRAVALENQVNALEARLQTESRLRELEIQRAPVQLPFDGGQSSVAAAGALPSHIDAWMAASNARVRAAAKNRR